jgi:hypothetical protein
VRGERKEARGGGANKKWSQTQQPHLSRATKPEICTFILSCGERAFGTLPFRWRDDTNIMLPFWLIFVSHAI